MKKILIIDDDPEVIKVLKLQLEKGGYEVVDALDGDAGLIKVNEGKPDLVLLDIMMPKMDGYNVCEKIKDNPSIKNIPVIMLTAKNMGDDVELALEKKADWYIAKPYDIKYLLKKIDELIKQSKK